MLNWKSPDFKVLPLCTFGSVKNSNSAPTSSFSWERGAWKWNRLSSWKRKSSESFCSISSDRLLKMKLTFESKINFWKWNRLLKSETDERWNSLRDFVQSGAIAFWLELPQTREELPITIIFFLTEMGSGLYKYNTEGKNENMKCQKLVDKIQGRLS